MTPSGYEEQSMIHHDTKRIVLYQKDENTHNNPSALSTLGRRRCVIVSGAMDQLIHLDLGCLKLRQFAKMNEMILYR